MGYYLFDVLAWFSRPFKSFPSAVVVVVLSLLVWIFFIIHNAFQARKLGVVHVKAFQRWYVYMGFVVVVIMPSFFYDSCSGTQEYRLGTASMSPAIEAGERVVVDMGFYKQHEIEPGDVVVFHHPKHPDEINAKRCIARGGQTVQIRDGIAYVNNDRSLPTLLLKRTNWHLLPPDAKDPRIFPPGAGNEDYYGPVTVPEGKIFVLGDLRDLSFDSRFFGFIDQEAVMGKVVYIWWSSNIARVGRTVR
jgi:signal peptidase I